MKFSNKKKIILGSIIGVLIGTLVSVSYAFFTYANTGTNSSLVTGDIYMRYKESSTTININDMMPRSTKPNDYFEFTVEGTNTTEDKDIIYDINIIHGDDYVDGDNDNTNDKVRIRDEFLRFTLEADLKDGQGMHEVLANKKYSDFSNGLRMWVYQINKNTTNKVTHTYRLYVWIDESVKIGNNGQDYTLSEWNNLFASVKVNVTGDFNEKDPYREPLHTIVRTHLTSDNSITDEDNVTYISGCREDAGCDAKNTIDFNYVWYSGKLWRVVSIYEDGTMKLVTENPITALIWGETGAFEGSWVYQWLNEDFKDTLVNKNKIIDTTKQWNATQTTDNSKPENTTMVSCNVGLINAYEYANSFKIVDDYSKGYLDIVHSGWWLITPYNNNGVRYIPSNGNTAAYGSANTDYGYSIRPSIYLKNTTTLLNGSGTRNNPYRIGEDINVTTINAKLNTRVSGEYVTFKNELFRIVGLQDNTTKIVKSDYITDNSTIVGKKFASSTTFGLNTNTQSDDYWDYYLNNTWLTSTDKTMLEQGTYYLGDYGYSENTRSYKRTICDITNGNQNYTKTTKDCDKITNTYTGYAGLLRVGEMFSCRLDTLSALYPSIFLITPQNSYNVNYIRQSSSNSELYNSNWSSQNVALPTVNLKSNVIITGGDGTENSPFQIALGSE